LSLTTAKWEMESGASRTSSSSLAARVLGVWV